MNHLLVKGEKMVKSKSPCRKRVKKGDKGVKEGDSPYKKGDNKLKNTQKMMKEGETRVKKSEKRWQYGLINDAEGLAKRKIRKSLESVSFLLYATIFMGSVNDSAISAVT